MLKQDSLPEQEKAVPSLEDYSPEHISQQVISCPELGEFLRRHPWGKIRNIDLDELEKALGNLLIRDEIINFGSLPIVQERPNFGPKQIREPKQLRPGMVLWACHIDGTKESVAITSFPYEDKGQPLVKCTGRVNGQLREELRLDSYSVVANNQGGWNGWNYLMSLP